MIGLAFKMILATGVVVSLMFIAARVMRHRMGPSMRIRTSDKKLIEILDRQSLARGSSIAVAQVGQKTLVLGITEQQVSSLGELNSFDIEDGLDVDWTTHSGNEEPQVLEENHSDSAWKSMVEQIRGMSSSTSED